LQFPKLEAPGLKKTLFEMKKRVKFRVPGRKRVNQTELGQNGAKERVEDRCSCYFTVSMFLRSFVPLRHGGWRLTREIVRSQELAPDLNNHELTNKYMRKNYLVLLLKSKQQCSSTMGEQFQAFYGFPPLKKSYIIYIILYSIIVLESYLPASIYLTNYFKKSTW
jgi:hypothetical protein